MIGVTRSVARRLNSVAEVLRSGADTTSHSGTHLRAASNRLSDGATELAANLQETSGSLEEISSAVKANADHAQHAKNLANQTRAAAEAGVSDMAALSNAMQVLQASSGDIAKIVQTIDSIAFQTNILALNAAVEAARAGEAGMGFCVVANEVRSLAQRSAQAAKESSAKIEAALAQTRHGVELNQNVAGALQEILSRARQLEELAGEVASASSSQSQTISQLNGAVSRIGNLTQCNAADAGQGAIAAEQLTAQAEALNHSVAELVVLVSGRVASPGQNASTETIEQVESTRSVNPPEKAQYASVAPDISLAMRPRKINQLAIHERH
jgi:methyl-accepting chemotaxis protein